MNIGFRADEVERIKNSNQIDTMKFPVSSNNFGQRLQRWESIEWREKAYPLRTTFQYQIIQYWRKEHSAFCFPNDSNCRHCFHKPPELIQANWLETPAHLEWAAHQEAIKKKDRHNRPQTWRDDKTTYEEIFKMHFTEEIDFSNYTMCDSGGCTD